MNRDWSDDILIAKLPPEPQTSDELTAVAKLALDRPTSDLIVDMGAVDEPTYQTLCRLTELRSVLNDRGCSCLFYNVSAATRQVLNLYGFDGMFEIAAMSEVVFEPSAEQPGTGTLELRSSDNSRPFQRRNYVRLNISSSQQVDVLLWHGGRKDDYHKVLPGHCWRGRLVDISEGGTQVAIDVTEGVTLGKGRLVGLEFRLSPAESLLAFDAQIREVLPTADAKHVCLGLQFVGLEANPEGREALLRLCGSKGIEVRESSQADPGKNRQEVTG